MMAEMGQDKKGEQHWKKRKERGFKGKLTHRIKVNPVHRPSRSSQIAWFGEGENIVIEKRYQRRMRSVKKYLQINDGENRLLWHGMAQ